MKMNKMICGWMWKVIIFFIGKLPLILILLKYLGLNLIGIKNAEITLNFGYFLKHPNQWAILEKLGESALAPFMF